MSSMLYKGRKVVVADLVWIPALGGRHILPWWQVGPAEARCMSKATVLRYAKARGIKVEVRKKIFSKKTFIWIGAGAGPSYRAALVDLLEYEEEREARGKADRKKAKRR